jgi:hypothetical protein
LIDRLHPGISLDIALDRIAEYAAAPARLEELSNQITAFRLTCCFERLNRALTVKQTFVCFKNLAEGVR